LFAALASCSTDTFEPVDQGPCTQTFECPVGYVCTAERCVLAGDAGVTDADAADDAADDAAGEGSGEGSGFAG
jgi:hypothetical protein